MAKGQETGSFGDPIWLGGVNSEGGNQKRRKPGFTASQVLREHHFRKT